MEKIVIETKGMHCIGCERILSEVLSGINCVKKVKADFTKETTTVWLRNNKADLDRIIKSIEDAGYEASLVQNSGNSNGLFNRFTR